jgi:chromosomal replication initiation ATPase DnaA
MQSTPRQLALDLPHRSALGIDDFLLAPSNAAAIALIDRWPDWPHWGAIVVGPAGSGKSHLAHLWQARSGAARIAALDIGEAEVRAIEHGQPLAIEDVDRGIRSEQVLFHVLNLARQMRGTVLLTSRLAPGDMTIALPDLRSRLRALPVTQIEAPDETLLAGLLIKLFADRQLVVEPHVVSYITRHMERSTEAAARIVDIADRLSLESKRRVTRAIAATAIGRQAGDD